MFSFTMGKYSTSKPSGEQIMTRIQSNIMFPLKFDDIIFDFIFVSFTFTSQMIPMPRLCHLTKDQHSYSFYLRDEEGHHLLEQVEEGGAAHKAGVREGDYIVEVNGSSILDENHDEV